MIENNNQSALSKVPFVGAYVKINPQLGDALEQLQKDIED